MIFSSFKATNSFSFKKPLILYLKYFVFYKFTCPGCNDSFVGEQLIPTKIKKHLKTDLAVNMT